jgi:hypothetical protein
MPRILILTALALLAVTAAGCGSKPTSHGVAQLPSATTTTTAASQNTGSMTGKSKADSMYRFSACMRSHGVRNFPDPQVSGRNLSLPIDSRSGLNPNAPQFKAAQKSCEKLLPNGGKPDPASLAKERAQMLKFSACMRSRGLAEFPDPTVSEGGLQVSLGDKRNSSLNPNSPVFQAAQKACQGLLPGPPGGVGMKVGSTLRNGSSSGGR